MPKQEELLTTITQACQDKKARDIEVLDLRGKSSLTDYFVLASGTSTTQVAAIADEVEEKLQDLGLDPLHREGYSQARWIVLDYDTVIVHIFHREEREYYALERLWSPKEKKEEESHESN